MTLDEIEKVLTDWIKQATEPPGILGKDIEPSRWIAQKFLRWWREEASSYLEPETKLTAEKPVAND